MLFIVLKLNREIFRIFLSSIFLVYRYSMASWTILVTVIQPLYNGCITGWPPVNNLLATDWPPVGHPLYNRNTTVSLS